MNWTAHFLTHSFQEFPLPPGLHVQVQQVSWAAQGGPEQAQIRVTGQPNSLWRLLGWLRYGVELENGRGQAVWWGAIYGVEVSAGAVAIGASLEDMSNSVAVAYTTTDGLWGTTAYQADADSTSIYGVKQLLLSMDNTTLLAAEQRRDRELAQRKYPIAVPSPGAGNDELSVTLDCRGWWSTASWPYYSRDEGQELHLPGSEAAQPLGLGFSSTEVAFEQGMNYLTDVSGNLGNFRKGMKLRISGSVSNDGVYTVEQGTERGTASYTAATISFDAAGKEIRDSANGLGPFDAHDVIAVSGSSSNNGYYRIESAAADGSKVVVTSALTDEGAGAAVTIRRGHHITVKEALTGEMTASSVTVTALGLQAAQRVQISSDQAWTAAMMRLKVRRVGNPTDNLTVALYSDAAGAPGSLLDSGGLSGTGVSVDSAWSGVDLSNTVSLAPAATYWFWISRSGGLDPDNYYEVMVDEDLGYSGGVMLLNDGSAWVSRPVEADMLFQILGLEATTTQIQEIISSLEFMAGSDIRDASGLSTNQYRDGQTTAMVELMDLLNLGTVNHRRLLATVTRDRIVQVREEPAPPDECGYFLRSDNVLMDRWGHPLPEGVVPVGQWIDLIDVIPGTAALDGLVRPAPFFCERVELDVERSRLRLEPRDVRSVWDLAAIREG